MTAEAVPVMPVGPGPEAEGSSTGRERLSQRVQAVPPSGIRKFFDVIATMPDVISLGVGEPDFTTPPQIIEEGVRSLRSGRTHYTSNYGTLELRRALASHLERLYGLAYNPEDEICVTVGASEAVAASMAALVDPGDEVVLHEPSYVAYLPAIVFNGGVPVLVPTTAESNFELDAGALEAAITPRSKVLFMGGHRHTPVASLPGMRERTVLIGGFSKAYAMTGWRVGYVCAPRDILEGIVKVHQYEIMSAPTTAQDAAVVALKGAEQDVERMVQEYDRRRTMFVAGLNALGLPTVEPHGAFYAFPSIRPSGLSSEDFAERLLFEQQVAVVPGNAFGPSGEGHVRATLATAYEQLEEALQRIRAFMDALKG